MDNNAQVDVLLKIKGQMEVEIAGIRDVLAGKLKALQSLTDTINLLRGWSPTQLEDVEKAPRHAYDKRAITEWLENFFLSHDGEHSIRSICDALAEDDLVPLYSDAVRLAITKILREITGISYVRKDGQKGGVYTLEGASAVKGKS